MSKDICKDSSCAPRLGGTETRTDESDYYNNKNSELSAAYEFQPAAFETQGPRDETTISFIAELKRKISEYSGDPFDSRYSVLIQFSDITPFSSTRLSR